MGTLRRKLRNQAGFTLVELLVTVGIVVALAAVIIPLVIQFANKGDEGSHAAEANTVQTAINTMMTQNSTNLISERLIRTSAVIVPGETFGIFGGDTFTDYMRTDGLNTECAYYWNTLGSVIQDHAIAPCIP